MNKQKGTLQQVWDLLTPAEHWKVAGLVALSVLAGLLDLSSVASILPFLSVLSQPAIITENPWMNRVYVTLGFTSTQGFLMFLGFAVLFLMILTNAVLALNSWLMERFTWTKHHELSVFLMEGYFARPYVSFLNRNSADLGRKSLVETFNFTRNVLSPMSDVISTGVSTTFILAFLFVVNPVISLLVAGLVGLLYALTYRALRRTIFAIGERTIAQDTLRYKTAHEALSGIKQIKILGREAHFIERFAKASRAYADSMTSFMTIRELPRYVLESLAFGAILVVVLYLMATYGDVSEVIPIVGLFAFAGYRLLPSFRALFKSLSQIRFQIASVRTVADEVEESRAAMELLPPIQSNTPLSFQYAIELKNISFAYPNTAAPALQNINLAILHNQSVAITGPTGAGKTTLVDILLGLFLPHSGMLSVDGVRVQTENIRSWQRLVGYVPQEIYLSDDTILRNIAFGVPDDEIDIAAAEHAARIANLHDFIDQDLPARYETLVGERGVRLSGGQRQRIGIARALYNDPQILVFDEATSSLDGITEKGVLDAIENIAHTKTLIMIAHRLSTVRSCDKIYVLDRGKVVAQGTYDELMEGNAQFRAMAKAGAQN